MKKFVIILFFSVAVILGSCSSIESLPDEPMIEFRSIAIFDTIVFDNEAKAGKLIFYFEDGDGDLGAEESGTDSSSPNLFFNLYRKSSDVFELADSTDPLYPSDYSIPYLEADGQNKILKGTIAVTMLYFLDNTADSLYYDFWVEDRSGNVSNTASTCIFTLSENSTCTAE